MANTPIHSMTDLWNSGGTTYYAIKMDVTNSASASGSKLFAMQIASANVFDIDKTGDVTLTSVDAGAAAGPNLTLYRNSATPAASDIIGKVLFQGEDSAGNTQDYADIFATITDPTTTSEDASLTFRNSVAGTMTTQAVITATGWNSMNIGATTPGTGAFTTLSATSGGSLAGTWSSLGTVTTVDLNGGTIDGTVIGGASAAAGTFTTLNATGGGALTGTWSDLGTVTSIDINGGTIDGTTIGAAVRGAAAFTTLAANSTVTFGPVILSGGTWSNLGSVTTIDINGGTIDGTAIGGATPAAGAFTTLSASGAVTITSGSITGITDLAVADGGTGASTPSGARTNLNIGTIGTQNSNNVTLTGGMIDATAIGGSTRAAGAFTTLGANSTVTFSNGGSMTGTWSDLGSVTTIDINGGTIDGTAIGGATPAAGAFTTISATGNISQSKATPTITQTDTGSGSVNFIQSGATLLFSVDGANAVASSAVQFNVDGAARMSVNATSLRMLNGITLRFATYTVATLPAGSTGDTVFATDCRVFNGAGTQEGAGLGTGGLVTYNGAAWKIEGTNVTAVA